MLLENLNRNLDRNKSVQNNNTQSVSNDGERMKLQKGDAYKHMNDDVQSEFHKFMKPIHVKDAALKPCTVYVPSSMMSIPHLSCFPPFFTWCGACLPRTAFMLVV